MSHYFFSLDLEEWYHLEYLKKYQLPHNKSFIKDIMGFFDFLDSLNVKITVFIVGETALQNTDIIKEIHRRGHEISCHGYEHQLVYNMTDQDFVEQIKKVKDLLENIIGEEVIGYRSPCFSLDNKKLELLQQQGIKYDASYIQFKEHKLYNTLDLSAFEKVESLVYRKGDFYEFEIPTLEILHKCIPISGGGYFRMFPLPLTKHFYNKYSTMQDNFIFYVHPFEVVNSNLDGIRTISPKDHFRFQVGRNHNYAKLQNYFEFLKQKNLTFDTFGHYIANQGKEAVRISG